MRPKIINFLTFVLWILFLYICHFSTEIFINDINWSFYYFCWQQQGTIDYLLYTNTFISQNFLSVQFVFFILIFSKDYFSLHSNSHQKSKFDQPSSVVEGKKITAENSECQWKKLTIIYSPLLMRRYLQASTNKLNVYSFQYWSLIFDWMSIDYRFHVYMVKTRGYWYSCCRICSYKKKTP